jgi:hypothetical protein
MRKTFNFRKFSGKYLVCRKSLFKKIFGVQTVPWFSIRICINIYGSGFEGHFFVAELASAVVFSFMQLLANVNFNYCFLTVEFQIHQSK